MKRYKLGIILSILFIICLVVLYFIDFNVKNFDLRFYSGKDNGLFSYFDVSTLTIIFLYVNLLRNILLALIFSFFYGILSFILIYVFLDLDSLLYVFLLHLTLSFLPIFIIGFTKNVRFLSLEFRLFNLYMLIVYILFLEINLRYSMDTSFEEIIFWYLK